MMNALGLLKQRRFLPLFATQFLGAFNDNLFKTVDGAVRDLCRSSTIRSTETNFTALATGLSHPAVLPVVGAGRAAGRQPRQGADHPHREDRRDRDHAGRRGRAAARAGRAYRRSASVLMLGAVLCARRPFDLLRADQIRDPAAASERRRRARRHRAGRGGRPISRSCSARSLAGCHADRAVRRSACWSSR